LKNLQQHAENIRRTIIEQSFKDQTGHVGSCLSCVEILTALFFKIMKKGDIFILSPGHKALALYATLKEKGIIKKINVKKLGGHPIRNPQVGIPVSTGSLGHGLSLGIGFAIANPKKKVYVLLSDGDMDEGSTLEAIYFIQDNNIKNIFGIVDCNGWSACKEKKQIATIDHGHDTKVLSRLLGRYYFAFIKTIKGKGLPRFENKLESHYKKVTKEDYEEHLRNNPA